MQLLFLCVRVCSFTSLIHFLNGRPFSLPYGKGVSALTSTLLPGISLQPSGNLYMNINELIILDHHRQTDHNAPQFAAHKQQKVKIINKSCF